VISTIGASVVVVVGIVTVDVGDCVVVDVTPDVVAVDDVGASLLGEQADTRTASTSTTTPVCRTALTANRLQR
jgi:hypothetical protein